MIRIFIVGSVRLYREGLADVLGRQAGIEVARVAADVSSFFDDPPCDGADVALLDMTVEGSLAAVRRATSCVAAPRIVAVAIPDDDHEVITCAEAGVHGYLTCNEPLGELLVAVEDAARGEAHCSPRVAAALLHRVRMLGQTAPVVPQAEAVANRLTSRELQIVALIAQGLSNKEIATRLMIELPTVKNHVHNILSKLGVKQRADAVRRVWSARAVAVGTLALLVSI